MAQSHKFQDLEETGEDLMAFISSSQLEKLIQVKKEQEVLYDQQADSSEVVTQTLKDVARMEENVGQMLMDIEEEEKKSEKELQNLEEQLRKATATNQITDSELQFLQSQLESLRSNEEELVALQDEVDEDVTEVIPSAVHVARLYHLITRIKWEYDTAPGVLKGVHYDSNLATPINIDTSTRSRSDISDQLWGFVSTEW